MLKSTHRSFGLRLSGTVLTALILLCDTRGVEAVEFNCTAGDVACLIAAIQDANANGEANTISLETGTYTLTVPFDPGKGAGLPAITSTLTIEGASGTTTVIERDPSPNVPLFRPFVVEASGNLTLVNLTLQHGFPLQLPLAPAPGLK